MQITAAKTISAAAIAGVAVLGAQYASAAPSQDAHAQIAPLRNIAHVYSARTSGGTGQAIFAIPNPGNGIYQASFSANFFPEGTPSAPETFSCAIVKDGGIMRAQDTVSTTYSSGFYAGVNGSNTIKMAPGSSFDLYCGVDDGTDWSWGTLPAQVTLTRLDGVSTGSLTQTARHKAGTLATVPGR
jgi:hypothetical protein